MDILEKYSKLNRKQGNKDWAVEHIAQGLVGDVGDLMKLVMAKNGLRKINNVDQKLAHELADCLWSIIVLSKKYNLDLETVFMDTMGDIEKYIDDQKSQT